MCGRARLRIPFKILAKVYGLQPLTPEEERAWDELFVERTEIFPTNDLAVLRLQDGQRSLSALRWGLVPPWAPDVKFGNRCINARVETAATSRAFRSALKSRRCAIVVDGFYEWRTLANVKPKRKERMFFHLPDEAPLAMAGLWEKWTSSDGEVVETCTILTREAEGVVAELHDRMPVVLPTSALDAWLDAGVSDPMSMLASYLREGLVCESAAHLDSPRRAAQGTLF